MQAGYTLQTATKNSRHRRPVTEPSTPRQNDGSPWLGAALAGLLGGLGDGIGATRQLHLAANPLRDGLLVGLSVLTALLVSGAGTLALHALARASRRGLSPSRWSGFVTGSLSWLGVSLFALLPGALAALSPLVLLAGVPLVRQRAAQPRLWAALLGVGLVAARVGGDERPRLPTMVPENPGPDIVVVWIDGIRTDQLARIPTGEHPALPEWQALATTGTTYTRAITPVTSREEALHAAFLGTTQSERAVPWARELQSEGWATASFGGPESVTPARIAGFGIQDHDPAWLTGTAEGVPGRIWQSLLRNDANNQRRSARRTVEAWQQWIATVPDVRPAVSMLVLTDAAWPPQAPPPWDTAFQAADAGVGTGPPWSTECAEVGRAAGYRSTASLRAAYDGALGSIDALLPSMFAALAGRPRGALVFVAGLRGMPLGEDDLWFDAAGHLHPATVSVPLWVGGADAPVDSHIGAPVSTLDIVATVRARAGLAPAPDAYALPGLVRGYPPRSEAHAVDGQGRQVVVTARDWFRSDGSGQASRWSGTAWEPAAEAPPRSAILRSGAVPVDPCSAFLRME